MRGWSARARTYAKTNIKTMVIFGGVGFAVAWVLNVWVMASVYDGFRTPTGAPATGTGNFFQGTLFYFLASALISSTISYRLLVGSERFWREIYGVPSNIKQAFTADSDATLVHVLVGFSAAMLIVLIVGPSAAAALAFGTLLVFTPVLRPVVTGVLLTVYRWLVGRVAPKRTTMPPTVSMLVGVTGSIAAFGLGGILPTSSALVVGLVAVVVAIVVAQRNKPSAPPTSVVLVALGAGVLAYWFGDVAIALADDGGMAECGNPGWSDWWSNCGGAGTVRDRAWIGATSAGTGAMIGAALGGSADPGTDGGPASDGGRNNGGRGPEDEPPPRFTDLLPGQQRALLTEAMRREDPSLSAEAIRIRVDEMLGEQAQPGELFRTLVDGIERDLESGDWATNLALGMKAVGDEFDFLLSADFGKAFAKELYEDWITGRMQDRVVMTMVEMDKGTTKAASDFAEMLTNSPELVGQGLEFLATASSDDLLALALDSGIEMTGNAVGDMKTKLDDLQAASLSGDDQKVAAIIGELSGTAQFDAILGMGVLKVVEARGPRPKSRVDVYDDTIHVDPEAPGNWRGPNERVQPWQEPDFVPDPKVRDDLLAKAKRGEPVELTPERAAHLGLEPDVVLEAWEQSLRWSTDIDGIAVEFKMGNLKAFELRQTGDYHYKPNYVGDKSLRVGEEEFFPKEMLENPPKPGQVVNYEPTHLPPKDHELYERIQERMKQADSWPDSGSKLIDPYDPVNRERYGLMYDEVGQPVDAVELYKGDNGEISMRFQRKDGSWSDTKAIAGDSDTFRLEGQSDALTPAQRERLGFQAGGGTIPGDGDFDKWVQSNYSEAGLKADVDEGLLLKQYQVGKQAMDEPVIRVTKDGPVLVEPDIKASMDSLAESLDRRLMDLPDGHWDDVIANPASNPKKAAMFAQLQDLGFQP